MKTMDLNTLVSLTYDSDPKVRKQAAVELAKCDPHQALYPLVQLTYDKDPGVQEVARNMLEEIKKKTAGTEPQLMSFADVFSHGVKEEAEDKKIEGHKEKMLRPIDQIFEKKLGKERGEEAKKKMMPTIEKIYMRVLGGHAAQEKEGKKEKVHDRERMVQEVLSSYLDALASSAEKAAEREEEGKKAETARKEGALVEKAEEVPEKEATEEPEEEEEGQASLEKQIGVVGREVKPEQGMKEVEESAAEDERAPDEDEGEEREEVPGEAQGATIFRFAYDTMMASDGDDKTMQEAAKVMKKSAEDQINLAFKVAKRKYSEVKLTNITELKTGMKNITTGVLFVKSVEHKDYQRTAKKRDTFTRIVVADTESNEGIVYLFEGRGAPITPGMKMKIEKGYAKTFEFSGETGMTVSKKGQVYILL